MALRKRGDTYHTRFTVHGKRYEVSLKTSDRREAHNLEKQFIADAIEGKLSANHKPLAKLLLGEAISQFIEDPLWDVADNSRDKARFTRNVIVGYPIAKLIVAKLRPEDVQGFMRTRLTEGYSKSDTNSNLNIIRHVIKRAKLWYKFVDEVKSLKPDDKDVGWALDAAQAVHLLEVAWTKPAWASCACASELVLNGGLRGGELKGLRWEHIHFDNKLPWLEVCKSKTPAGKGRPVELNSTAVRILRLLQDEAMKLGTGDVTHYVFCRPGQPTRPRAGWRTAWASIIREAAKQFPQLANLRFHDLRHTFVTNVAEVAFSETGKGLVGHSPKDQKTFDRYNHTRRLARMTAVQAIDTSKLRDVVELERMVGVVEVLQ